MRRCRRNRSLFLLVVTLGIALLKEREEYEGFMRTGAFSDICCGPYSLAWRSGPPPKRLRSLDGLKLGEWINPSRNSPEFLPEFAGGHVSSLERGLRCLSSDLRLRQS